MDWCYPFSWTNQRRVLVDCREDLFGKMPKFNGKEFAAIMASNVLPNYKRKHFEEFSYITVDPPTWAIFLTWFLTLGISIGVIAWSIKNEYTEDNPNGGYRFRY